MRAPSLLRNRLPPPGEGAVIRVYAVIQYSLICDSKHSFDAWFKSSEAYDDQAARGILVCPVCNSRRVEKAVMTPAVARTDQDRVPVSANHPGRAKMIAALRALRDKLTAEADYVGPRFAEEARKMHWGEADRHSIYGEATRDEVAALIEEGVEFMPLPRLPDDHN